MLKKFLIVLGLIAVIYGVLFAVSPKVRSASKVLAASVRNATVSTARRVSPPTLTPTRSKLGAPVINNCTYKEFTDLSSINDPSYGWAYFLMHAAKQHGIFSYFPNSNCNDPYSISPAAHMSEWDLECVVNKVANTSFDCNTLDDSKTYMQSQYQAYEQVNKHIGWQSSTPNYNPNGGSCDSDTDPACVHRAEATSWAAYNKNTTIWLRIQGKLTVARNATSASSLVGSKVELFQLLPDGTTTSTTPLGTATAVQNGPDVIYSIDSSTPVRDFYLSQRRFQARVTPPDSFYPDARDFYVSSIVTNNDLVLTWKEDPNQNDFVDVPPTHWAYWYVQSLKQNKIMGGYADKTFHPDDWMVYRSEAAIYSTLSTGQQVCCAPGIEQFTSTCKACAGYQYFTDLPLGSYYWGYAQSALLAGTMRGFQEPDGTYTFRPSIFLRQDLTRVTLQNAGRPADLPPSYPFYSPASPVSRGQLAALYAWNFNKNVTAHITGQITVRDARVPITDIKAENIGLYLFAGHQKMDAAVNVSYAGSNLLNYEIILTKPIQWMISNAINKYFEVEVSGTTILPTSSQQFQLTEESIENINIEANARNIVKFHGEIHVGDAKCPQVASSYSSTVTINYNGQTVTTPAVFKDGAITYSTSIQTLTEDVNISMALAGTNDYLPVYANFAIPAGAIDVERWFNPMPKLITLSGRITDVKTKAGVAYAALDFNDKTYSTDEAGYMSIDFRPKADIPTTPEDEGEYPGIWRADVYGGGVYEDRLDVDFPIVSCPGKQYFQYELDKSPICQTISGNQICWFGKEAKSWKNSTDPAYANAWTELSNKLNEVQSKGLGYKAKGIAIVSGADNGWANDWEGGFGGWIQLGTTLLASRGFPANTQENLATVTHEYGHLFYKFRSAQIGIDAWRQIYTAGINLYKGSSPDIWYWAQDSSWRRTGGHPEDNTTELFASTFFIMDGYRAEFETLIRNSGTVAGKEPRPLNAEGKNWYISLYNQHVTKWPTGDPDGKFTAMLKQYIGLLKKK